MIQELNKSFSFPRLMFAVRRNITLHARLYGLGAAAYFAAVVLLGIIIAWFQKPDAGMPVSDIANGLGTFVMVYGCYVVTGAFVSGASSMAFSDLSAKNQRLGALVLPISKIENFLATFVVSVLIPVVLVAVTVTLAELIRLLILPKGAWNVLELAQHFRDFEDMFVGAEQNFTDGYILSYIAMLILAQAAFFFGSTLWPKWSFIKTLVVGYVLLTIMSIVLWIVAIAMGNTLTINPYFTLGLYSMLAVIFYVLAWVRFNRLVLLQRFIMS